MSFCENQSINVAGHKLCLKAKQLEGIVHNKVFQCNVVILYYGP